MGLCPNFSCREEPPTTTVTMVADTYTIKIKKFITNPLLERKQFAIDVVHPNRANISKSELKERLSKLYKVSDSNCIILFGFKTAFGGSRSSGFGLIYDNLMSCKRFEKRLLEVIIIHPFIL